MTFGWQGFALEHPEDWAPVTLTGARREGYVRIASPNKLSFQVRWKASPKGHSLENVLKTYLDRLSRDAKSAKKEFFSEIEQDSGMLLYQYSSTSFGRGAILHSPACGRVFFLEVISSKPGSLQSTFRAFLNSFTVSEDTERWALFGLNLKVPKGLELEREVRQPGRTQLLLTSRRAQVETQRWAMAEQLIAKHGLEQWTRSVLNLPKAESNIADRRVTLTVPGSLIKTPVYALACHQPERNQLSTLKVTTKDDAWRPAWDWFA